MKTLFIVPLACIAFSVLGQSTPNEDSRTIKQKAPEATQPTKPEPAAKAIIAPKTNAATSTATSIIYDGPSNEAVEDLRQVLQRYSAGEIRMEKVGLGARSGQEFYLERKNDKTLIKYTTNASLENAIYTLLNMWGFHWYGPGEDWFVKPSVINGSDIAGKWVVPTFRNRSFFGTGGLDVIAPNDPENQYKESWSAWKRRNRFNSDFAATGHIGQAFYLENKDLLDKYPAWFNSDRGRQRGRLKIEIPAAVAAYKAWTKRKFAGIPNPFIDKDIDPADDRRGLANPFLVIGVDPADGRGGKDDPLPPNGFAGINKWNHADKWWWLANEVAKEYPENNSHTVVSMYAYGDGATNALVPKIQLRKNVYPVIIPYAFQTAYLPQEMVKVWANKINGTMGLYDYWNITPWSHGLPQFDLHGMKNKLKFWRANKVDGLYIETTDAAGPMGHSWWLAGQLQFDLSKDFNGLYNQYLTDLFGKAAPAMKKMYNRWSQNPQGAGEVALSLADLKAADAKVVRNSPEWKRINELKAYVHFMKLYHEHNGTQASKNRLFSYLYSIHHLFLVQTSAFMGQAYISPIDKGNIIPHDKVKPLTDEEIDTQFRADLLSNPKKYEIVDFQFDHARAKYLEPADKEAWRFGRRPTAYFVPQAAGTVSFDAGNKGSDTTFSVFTNDGIILKQQIGPSNFDYIESIGGRAWHMKRYQLRVEAKKTYYVQFMSGFNRFKMNSKVILYNSHNNDDFDNYAYPTQYLYIPKNCNEIIYEDILATNGDGSIVTGAFHTPGQKRSEWTKENYGTPIGIKNLHRVAVKPSWKGKVIACSFGRTGWSLKSLPNVLSLQKFTYAE